MNFSTLWFKKFMVEKSWVENFMVKKSGVEKSGVKISFNPLIMRMG